MFAKINHVAIVSENYALLSKFYESVFGMRTSGKPRYRATTVGDGYVGLNINPRPAGKPARLDHFGVQVEDVETVFSRLQRYPRVQWLKRPATRPFAGVTAHDMDGNLFDLSQKDMTNRKDIYVESEWHQDRRIDHIAIRTSRPEQVAEFYAEVLELSPLTKAVSDPNFYLSDGRITLILMPWRIIDYEDTGIILPGLDHIGFKVESVAALKRDVEEISGNNPHLTPSPLGTGSEGAALESLFKRSCPLGHYHFADTDGVLLDVAE
jgi:catechol 2,3-dioxygenase-like lactoylglutathione lyase family enzyme